MDDFNKNKLIGNLADNLPVLRAKLGLTQEELASMIGVSRHTIISIENKKRKMAWNTFLSLLLVFIKNEETNKLLGILDVYTDELNEFIKRK